MADQCQLHLPIDRLDPQMTESNLFTELASLVAPFAVRDTLSKIAALQLVPANSPRHVRLQVLSHAAASIADGEDRPQLARSRFLDLVNGAPLASSVGYLEDPFDSAFILPFKFWG